MDGNFLVWFLIGFILLASLSIMLADAAARHPGAQDAQNLTFVDQTQESLDVVDEMVATTQSNQISEGSIFGIPFAISLNALSSLKLIFKLWNIMQVLITDLLDATGLGIGWLAPFLLAVTSFVLLLWFISAILRYTLMR